MGSPKFQSNKDVTILNITGDESSLSDPIYDAVPVRCRQINGQYFSFFANANHNIIALCLQCHSKFLIIAVYCQRFFLFSCN